MMGKVVADALREKPAITLPVMRRYRIDNQNYPQKVLRYEKTETGESLISDDIDDNECRKDIVRKV